MSLTVRVADLKRFILNEGPFVALPREEIERLHAAIEVRDASREPAEGDLRLVACAAVHFNYSWLTYQRAGARSLGIEVEIGRDGRAPLFLDDEIQGDVERALTARGAAQGKIDVRLGGLLIAQDRLGLLYLARLRQPDVAQTGLEGLRFSGNGDLRQERAQFDAWSQVLIDNLVAF
jgi:hypothetical protein